MFLRKMFVSVLGLVALAFPSYAHCQTAPGADTATGSSPIAFYSGGHIDNVNPVNGNVFLNLPLLSYPQQGHSLRLSFRIYYNDKQWSIYGWNDNLGVCFPSGCYWGWSSTRYTPPNNIGVYVARDQHLDLGADGIVYTATGGGDPQDSYTVTEQLLSWFARESDGAKHYYSDSEFESCGGLGPCPAVYSHPSEFFPSLDGSGYSPQPGGILGTTAMTGPDGIKYVVNPSTGYETITDPSGNAITQNGSGWVDSLGRTLPGSLAGPGVANNNNNSGGIGAPYFKTSEPIPGVPVAVPPSCPAGAVSARQWQVPAPGGQTETIYLCYSNLAYATAFNLDALFGTTKFQAVAEASSSANGPVTLLTAVVLPNGSSYQFSYDSYLSLSKITLPNGGFHCLHLADGSLCSRE